MAYVVACFSTSGQIALLAADEQAKRDNDREREREKDRKREREKEREREVLRGVGARAARKDLDAGEKYYVSEDDFARLFGSQIAG